MTSPDSEPYERGDALEQFLSSPDAVSTSEPGPDEHLYELSEDQYWTWLEALLQQGRELDDHLDDLLDEIYDCQPAFYNWRGRQTLDALLDELHETRGSVRAFEQDVEQISVAFSRTEVIETQAAENAEMVLSQIKGTYDRAYDLCLYKLDRMSDGWITATNILISVTILVVTILFWMEFWE